MIISVFLEFEVSKFDYKHMSLDTSVIRNKRNKEF